MAALTLVGDRTVVEHKTAFTKDVDFTGPGVHIAGTLEVIGALTLGPVNVTADAIDSTMIAAGAVDVTALGALAVTTAKIDTGAVTAAKLGALAVETAAINTGAVTAAKLAAVVSPLIRYSAAIGHADLTDADTSQAVALAGFPANAIPVFALVELDTAFSGPATTAVTVKLGDAGADGELMAAVNIFTGVAAGFVQGVPGAAAGAGIFEAAYAPVATVVNTTGTLADLTAGAMTIHIYYLPIAAVTA